MDGDLRDFFGSVDHEKLLTLVAQRVADGRVVRLKAAAEARSAVDAAHRILKQLGVELHPQKTRVLHVRYGFEFLGYKIKYRERKLYLPDSKIRSQVRQGALYAYPKEKSIRRFMGPGTTADQTEDTSDNQGAD